MTTCLQPKSQNDPIIPWVGPPKPRTKSRNTPAHLGTERRGSKWGFWVTLGQDLGYLYTGFGLNLVGMERKISKNFG